MADRDYWNTYTRDTDLRHAGDRDDRYASGSADRYFEEHDREKDRRTHRDGHSRSSSSSSRKGRRSRREGRSSTYSRSRSRSRSRTKAGSRSPSSHRRRGRYKSSRSSSRSRSRSRERYDRSRSRDRYARSPRLDDEYFDGHSYHRDRRVDNAPPNATLVIKGLPPDWDETVMWELLSQHGFQPKDIRILKRRDTGQGRGFGFVEFLDVDEATRWMEHTQGRLKVDDRYWADIQYSRAPHSSNAASVGPASALAAILAQRGGDWICAKCGTNNFKKRDFCFKCNLKREESETLSAEGYAEVGVLPCDTLLLRNLPTTVDEDQLLSTLKEFTSSDIVRVVIARNPSPDAVRNYAYAQMTNATEAGQLLTSLTVTKLSIEGQEISVSYSKIPLTVVLTGSALTQSSGTATWPTTAAVPASGYNSGGSLTQTDVTNAAAAVAQSAIKKAHVLRHVAAQQVQQAAQLASFRAASMFMPTSSFLLQHHQQVLAARALHEMATVQLLQEHATRQTGPLADLGMVQTPHGELPKYPVPEVHQFQLDPTTGYYYDPTTGLHYDANSQYFYNSETRQYLYWDSSYQTYLPAPSETGNPTAQQPQQQQPSKDNETKSDPNVAGDKAKVEKKEGKEKKEKANMAKKIQRDMEKWAKQLNQRKEAQKPASSSTAASAAAAEGTPMPGGFNEEKMSGSADAAFSILERTGGAPGFKGDLSYDAGDSDDDLNKTPSGTRKRHSEDFADWTKIACLLCRRQFPSKETLIKHQQFSDLHKKNLLSRQQPEGANFGVSDQTSSGIRYRDRAKERREKFGTDEKQPRYHDTAANATAARPGPSELATSETAGGAGEVNIGSKLLKSMGWQEGQGLGRSNQGIVDPIMSQRRIQGAGLGASGAVVTAAASASYKEHVKAALRQKFFQDL